MFVLAPLLTRWQSWLMLAATLMATSVARRVAARNPDWAAQMQTEDRTTSAGATLRESAPLLACVILVLAAALTYGASQTARIVKEAVTKDDVALMVTGALAAVFVGGILVSFVLTPFTRVLTRQGESPPSLKNAGTYIGWFERGLLFAFIFGGKPEAAAIALAAKSFARFPSLSQHHEGFAEYFLIGSLASVAVALGVAVATRVALGQAPF
jgi:hypothetical protein